MCELIFIAIRGYVSWSEISIAWNIFNSKLQNSLKENPHNLYNTYQYAENIFSIRNEKAP